MAQKDSFQIYQKGKMWSEKQMKCGTFALLKFVSEFSGYSRKTVQSPAEWNSLVKN